MTEENIMIKRKIGGGLIRQRVTDGYINATELCTMANKKYNDYARLKSTKKYIKRLAESLDMPVRDVVHSQAGGDAVSNGTWVHPDVAMNLAQWLSPEFAVQVSQWAMDSLQQPDSVMPVHLKRYLRNKDKIPHTHFSVLNEVIISLVAPLESRGYLLPENLMPDISQGLHFPRHLRDKFGVNIKELLTYTHEFTEGDNRPPVEARLYPIEYIVEFKAHFHEVWLMQKAIRYFKERDPKAIEALESIKALSLKYSSAS